VSHEDELYNLVKEIHGKVEAVEGAISETAQARTVRHLPGELGTVTVTGGGQLVDVSLDMRALKTQTGASLGRQIMQGIQQAEKDAAARRDSTIAAAREKARFR
jgi:DNA-binding protein YbaB